MTTTPTQSPRRHVTRLLGGLVLLAFALRFATLGVQSLDADEAFTAEIAHKGFGAAMSQVPHTESSPPLYYALVWLWTKLFGTSEWGLRSLSALAGTAAVPVVYAIGARLKSERAGLIAAAFCAVSPLLVWYSQEARAYMLFMLLSTVAFLMLVRGRVWLWALASAAALATHYFAAVVVVPMAVWLLWRRRAILPVAAAALVGAALVPLAVYQANHVSRPWANALSALDGLLATSQSFLVGISWTWLIHRPGVLVLGLLAVAMAWRARREPAAALPAAIAAAALIVPFLLSLAGPKYFTPGNELAVWPLIALVLAMGASRALAAITCALMLAITLAGPLDPDLQRENWRDLVGSLAPADRGAVVLNAFEDTRVVRYYLRSQTQPHPVPEFAVVGRLPRDQARLAIAPAPGARIVGGRRERKIGYSLYRGPPALGPPGSLYQRP